MRTLAALLMSLLIGGQPAIDDGKEKPAQEAPEKRLQLTFRLLEGDPQGKAEPEKLQRSWQFGEWTNPDFFLEIDPDDSLKKPTPKVLRVTTKGRMVLTVDQPFNTQFGGSTNV